MHESPMVCFQLMVLISSVVLHGIQGLSTATQNTKTFHFGAGCFWAPADQLRDLPGIVSCQVGYCGDDETPLKSPPSYETVCSGRTSLVEAVRVEYNSAELKYEDILSLFALVNTAEYGNKRQYEGIIFTSTDEETVAANKFLEEKKHVVAKVEPMTNVFYTAEKYHQDYWLKWRIRLPIFFGTLASVGYFGGDMSQTLWNILCYGAIAFTLLERKIDTGMETIVVDRAEDNK